jgi:uncharacterized protein YggU (UPF0235/DUF167 family)
MIKHIRVKVYSDRTKEKIVINDDGSYDAYLREPAKQGMANKRLLRLLTVLLEKISPRPKRIRIASGHTSCSKIIEVEY